MPNDRTDQLLAEIGHLLRMDVPQLKNDTLLYAQLASNMVYPSIYCNLGNNILYISPDLNKLGNVLLDLWEAEPGDRRWAEIEYLIRGDRFDVTYIYPEEIAHARDDLDRRDQVARRYFGDKPITYPPLSDDNSPSYEF